MSERLEEIKNKYMDAEYDYNLNKYDIDWLIEQAERVQYFTQKNGELNVFLQKHNEPKHLGKNVVDVAMNVITEQAERVQELESDDFIKVSLKSVDEVFKLRKQNKRYREAINESIKRIKDDGEYNQLHYDVESILSQALEESE